MAGGVANLTPARPGNDLAVKHGAYSLLRLAPRVEALAAELRELVPARTEADGPAIEALAVVLAQLERASVVLTYAQADDVDRIKRGDRISRAEREELARLQQDARGWANTARRYLNDLGLTPTARAKLGLNVVRARGEALRAHLAESYDGGSPPSARSRSS